MLGKPAWFRRRKYGGWGFSPACWQGWLYVAALFLSLLLIQALPVSGDARLAVMVIWAVVFSIDFLHIFLKLPKDERETIHEAKAERNAMWAMVFVLCAGVAYQVARGLVRDWQELDPVILAALAAGVVAKAITNIYLDAKH